MSPVAAPADKRFRRAHVKPARRRRWRALCKASAKYGLVAVLTAYGLYWGGSVVAQARVLQIDHLTVRGNRQLSTGAVLTMLGNMRGQSILWSDLGAWRRRLLASPWVGDAALRRVLPSTIEITIQEREPIGIARIDGGLYLIDEHGAVIDEFGPVYADFDLPIVDGLHGARMDGDESTDRAGAELAARLILSVRSDPGVNERVSQVNVSNPRNAGVILSGDPAVIYVGDDRFLPRLHSYLQLADTLRKRMQGIDYVDLRFDDRIIVGPAGTATGRGSVSKR
jgi:cell division protein FtsQ